jgi:ribokinase
VFGGKGANTAVAAARAGGDVTFVAALGDDVFASVMKGNFEQDGICTDHLHIEPGIASGSALIMVDRNGDNYLAVAPGANYSLSPSHLEAAEAAFHGAGMVVMQMEIPTATILRSLQFARESGTRVLFNYAPVRDLSVPVTGLMDVLVVNEKEANGLAVESVSRDAAKRLKQLGARTVIVTLGAAGIWIESDEFCGHLPAFAVEAVDTTAAGDTFCGALAVALVEGQPLREAVRFASAASAISVMREGAQPSIPHRGEIDAFLKERG